MDRAAAPAAAATWPPELETALERLAEFSPAAVRRARSALGILAPPLPADGAAEPPARRSALTGDGFPFEFTFSSASSTLAYTVDPGCAGPTSRALGIALEALRALGQPEPDPAWLEPLRAAQEHATLGYGAWIGGRHGGDRDRFKLYLEVAVPAAAALTSRSREFLTAVPTLPDREVTLRMIGLEPASARVEFYFRAPSVDPDHLPGLLRPLGLIPRAGEVSALLAELYGHPLGERIPGARAGFSYAVAPPGAPGTDRTFTLFVFARALWGGDARIRRRFAAFCERRGHDPAPYLRVTEPVAGRDEWRTFHGLLGLVVGGSAPIQLAVGVRPPPRAAAGPT